MRRLTGFGEILVCTLTWGSISPIVAGLDVGPGLIVLFRVAIGGAVVLAAAAVAGRLSELRPRGDTRLLISSGLVLAVHWVALFETYKRLDVASSVAIVFIGPVVGAAVTPMFLGDRTRARTLIPVGIAFMGLAAITVPNIQRLDAIGVLMGLFAALTFAALLVIGKVLSRTETPLSLSVWQLCVATLPMLVFLGSDSSGVPDALPILLMLGAVHTGAMALLFFRAMRELEPHQLGTLFYIEPAAAVIYAWIFLQQVPTVWVVVGFLAIVGAGVSVVFSQPDPPIAPVASPETTPRPRGEA